MLSCALISCLLISILWEGRHRGYLPIILCIDAFEKLIFFSRGAAGVSSWKILLFSPKNKIKARSRRRPYNSPAIFMPDPAITICYGGIGSVFLPSSLLVCPWSVRRSLLGDSPRSYQETVADLDWIDLCLNHLFTAGEFSLGCSLSRIISHRLLHHRFIPILNEEMATHPSIWNNNIDMGFFSSSNDSE